MYPPVNCVLKPVYFDQITQPVYRKHNKLDHVMKNVLLEM